MPSLPNTIPEKVSDKVSHCAGMLQRVVKSMYNKKIITYTQ
jgi:hypothetical protein